MYLAVIDVKPLADYRLLLTFENNERRIFDVSPYLNLGKFSELKDLSLFNTVKIKFDSIEWNNHLDLDPEFLYQKSEKELIKNTHRDRTAPHRAALPHHRTYGSVYGGSAGQAG